MIIWLITGNYQYEKKKIKNTNNFVSLNRNITPLNLKRQFKYKVFYLLKIYVFSGLPWWCSG